MIAFAQLGKLTRSWTAHEKEYAGSVPLCFVDAECGCRTLASGRNRHHELARTRHIDQIRRVKSYKNYAGCKLGSIEYASLVYRCSRDRVHADCHSRIHPDILP